MPTLRRILIDLTVMLALGVALALLGPFGSFGAPFATRLLYWLSLSLGGYFLYMPVVRLADGLAGRLQLPAAALWAAGCVAVSAPMTAIVWVANAPFGHREVPTLEQVGALYGDVLIVAGIACLMLWFLTAHRRRMSADGGQAATRAEPPPLVFAPSAPDANTPMPRLIDRLPPHLGRDLLALEMEDHYVRAHTPAGSVLLLLRMRDAVAELDGVDGALVHRSWWVARDAVTGVARDGRNVRLQLVNGVEAPVARAAAPELKAAGWW